MAFDHVSEEEKEAFLKSTLLEKNKKVFPDGSSSTNGLENTVDSGHRQGVVLRWPLHGGGGRDTPLLEAGAEGSTRACPPSHVGSGRWKGSPPLGTQWRARLTVE